ncbi:MAG: protein kinase [Myxococcota bacterium]
MSSASEPPRDRPDGGADISGFDLQRRLGAGGMAEVFLAKKRGAEGTYKQLVLKRILPQHSSSRRFRHMFVEEAHLATRLNHPNIVQVYEFSHHEDDLLLSMEYVEGVDLGKLVRVARQRSQPLPRWVAAFIAAEVAKGLHYAHERRDEGGLPLEIVHRDVSPQNILLSFGGVVKIADFGIATANLFREETGVLKGKFRYMSPEQARGEKVDRRSDIYGLGVVLYEMLTLTSPYGKLSDEALAEAVRYGQVKAPSAIDADIPPRLDDLVMRALQRRPEDRFATAREMAAEVARALLEEQELVDATTVEDAMATVLGASEAGADDDDVEPAPRTMAAVRKPRTSASEMSAGTAAHTSRRVVREVRHVAVVKLRLEGLEDLAEVQSEAGARRSIETIRHTLDEIAYKHGAVWSWSSDTDAYAVAGLLANPSRAPNDAALIAVDVHEFLSSHSEDLPVPVRGAVGIVRGIATGERDADGHLQEHRLNTPANFLADALGARTPTGRTWVAGGVYRLVRREFRWSDGPVIELPHAPDEPVPERMRVYVLLRPLTVDERRAEMALNPTDLVGRDAEKADLHAAYHRAVYHPGVSTIPPPPEPPSPEEAAVSSSRPPASSNGRSARGRSARTGELLARVIVGEMGIGKTALLDTFLEEIPSEARVFRVECSPVKIDLPYATATELLREVTGLGSDDGYEDAVERLSALLGSSARPKTRAHRLVPRLAELIAGERIQIRDEEEAHAHRDLLVTGMKMLFGAIARSAPVVIVVDSLQWADRMSLELLQRLLEREEPLPVLTLLVARQEDRLAPHLEGLVRTELRPLSAEEQIRLVQSRLGVQEGVAAVCRELVPRVGGNPYFLLEMVDALLERGVLDIVEPDDGGDSRLVRHDAAQPGDVAEALPTTIEQLVGDRLAELPSAEHDVVDWLAVAGGPLTEVDLITLTRLADDEAISRLCARGLCDRRGKSVDFRHPLARDVAYGALEAVRRARMHRRLGEYQASTPLARGLSAAIVAQHLERGGAPRQAAESYLEAAFAAQQASQNQLSVRYFQRTLSLLPVGDHRRLNAHAALERIFRSLGRSEERKVHLDELRKMARDGREARWVAVALVRSALFALDQAQMAKGLPLAQRAADMARFAGTPDLEVEALIILCELLRDLGDVNGALDSCERALEVCDRGPVTPRARAEVLRAKGVLLRRAGRLNAATESHAEAIAIFKAAGAPRSEARARNSLGFALFVLGRYEDCIAMCLSAIAIDVEIGGRFKVAKTLANVGMAYARLGQVEQGMAYLLRARDAHERYDDQDGRIDTLLVAATTQTEQGRLDEAKQWLGDATALATMGGNVYDRIHQLLVAALVARAEGDALGAATSAAEAKQLAEGQALVSYHVFATSIEAAARVDAGDTQAGVLLATTALGAVEAMEGSEYGTTIRSLCVEAVTAALGGGDRRDTASVAADVCRRALDHVDRVAGYIRDPEHREAFFRRPPVRAILERSARMQGGEADTSPAASVARLSTEG